MPFREQWLLPRHLHRSPPTVMHAPCSTAPLWGVPRLIVTLHDTIELLGLSETAPSVAKHPRRWLMTQYSRRVQMMAGRQAYLVVTDSQHSARDLVRHLGLAPQRVRVVPLAQRPQCIQRDPQSAWQSLRQQWPLLPQRFVLSMGAASPRKNLHGLLSAYARLTPQLRNQYPLVLTLAHSLHRSVLLEQANHLGLAEHVHILEHVSDDALVSLYQAATLFCFPSLYEGFGLPVLEAMACGTPVLTSNRSSIPEVAGGAAVLVDPTDHNELSRAIHVILSDDSYRRSLSKAGLMQASRFSWERTAEMTLSVYREAIAPR